VWRTQRGVDHEDLRELDGIGNNVEVEDPVLVALRDVVEALANE
jgi:hypothetical protein